MGGASASGGGIGGTSGRADDDLSAVDLPAASARDVAVSAVTSTGSSPVLILVATGAGALTALVVVSMFGARWPELATPTTLASLAALAWGLAGWWVLHKAYRRRVALRRGFGLGAWLWLALRLAHEPTVSAGSGAGVAPSAGEGMVGLATRLADPLALIMLWVCALAYVVLWFASRPPRRASAYVPRGLQLDESAGPSIQK